MKSWKIAIVRDTSKPMLGLHGLHMAFHGLPGVEIAALVDGNPEHLDRKLAQMRPTRHYLSCEAMFEDITPDIMVITSRHPGDHLPQIRLAAQHGCHVYCEKPLARTLEEAYEIQRVVESSGIRLAMAHPARHAQSFLTLRRMIHSGDIGRPLTIHGRGKSDHRGGGEDLVVLGTHILDLMAFIFGPPEHVWADITAQGKPISRADRTTTVEPIGPCAGDSVVATFGFADGVRGIFESHRDVFTTTRSRGYMGVTVTGTQGALAVRFEDAGDAVERLLYFHGPCAPEAGVPAQEIPLIEDRIIPGAAPLELSRCGELGVPNPMFMKSNRFAAWDLMQALEHNRPPAVGVADACSVQAMIQGIYASHLSGQRVAFPLTSAVHPLEG